MDLVNTEEAIFNQRLGSFIQKRRKELKISQKALGEYLGVTFQQIQKYEAGRNNLNAYRFMLVAKLLDIPIQQLLTNHIGEISMPGAISAERDSLIALIENIKDKNVRDALEKLIERIVNKETFL